ncbi:MAG: type II toxin-antitoxin system Phd/YefM family antitoxin [Devosia sp.]
MRATTAAALSKNLAAEIEKVKAHGEPLAVVSEDGETEVYIVSREAYEAEDATQYLQRSPENARRLDESIAQYHAGKVIKVDWPE